MMDKDPIEPAAKAPSVNGRRVSTSRRVRSVSRLKRVSARLAAAARAGVLAISSIGCVAEIDAAGPSTSDSADELRCDVPSAGAAPLRRLTREQYDNTIRDLLGIEGHPSQGIAQDEKLAVFASNSVASVSRLAAEQYADVAEELAEQAAPRLIEQLACDRPALGDAACGAVFIERFGRRAYRRPLTSTETQRYLQLFRAAASFADGVRLSVTAMLQSANFVYHLELPAAAGNASVALLDSYQLASRLSYGLWNTMPDDALLRAAEEGRLASSEGLRGEAERLLDDDRAADAIASFHTQWLHLDTLATVGKDAQLYPEFDGALRQAMLRETLGFADYVIRRGDGKLNTLLTAPFTFADGPLLALYGAEPGAAPGQPVALNPKERAGLLTQAAFLSANAHRDQSSPIRRGLAVRQNVLCQMLPDPPANVNNTPPAPAPGATTRERFVEHTRDPSCAGCHTLIDPVGFAFENYDAIGRYRTLDNGLPVDAQGELSRVDEATHPVQGAVEMAHVLAESQDVRNCVARQWFRFALGRLEQQADACSLKRLEQSFERSDYDVRELLLGIVTSDAFRYARGAKQ